MLKQFLEIRKVDEEARMVWGYASTEAVDSQGEVITKAAMEAAWDDYMKFANVREMHSASAVGVVKEYSFDDAGVMIGAYIVDDMAWKKVQTEVYKGFSIGGKKLPGGYDAISKTITALKLTEISLVDRPANPEALITMWKADSLENETMDKDASTSAPVDQLAELLNKGVISPERLVELATADITKTAEVVPPVVAPVAEVEKTGTVADTTVVPAIDASPKTDETVPPVAKAVEGGIGTGSGDAPVVVEPCALQKTMKLLVVTGDDVRKGMYSVSRFADLVQSLVYLQQDCAYEAQYEGDNSPLPVQLAQAASGLGALLVAMAQEEVAELVASLKMPEGSEPLEVLSAVIANSETGKDYMKFHEAFDILKAGARNNKNDADRIQKSHDLMADLGACCKAADDTANKLQKAADNGTIHKALESVEKMASDLGNLRKSFDTLTTEHTELKKRFEAAPAAPKGVVLAVAKGEDVSAEQAAANEIEPVLKQDGSIDVVATEIKKVHAGGGRAMFPLGHA